jgi:hypothetical protein
MYCKKFADAVIGVRNWFMNIVLFSFIVVTERNWYSEM